MAMNLRESIVRNRVRLRKVGFVALVVLLISFILRLSFGGGPVNGRVIDVETNLPIKGAFVVARWQKSSFAPGHSTSYCYHVETAVTGEDGRYHVSRWWQFPPVAGSDGFEGVDAYSPGYESVHSHTPEAESHPDDVYMKRFRGTDAERFEFITGRVFSGMSCTFARGGSQRNFFPLSKAALNEAKTLVRTEQQRKTLRGMRLSAAEDWLAAPLDSPVEPDPLSKLPAEIRRELE